jgi:hypothetical protein
MYCGVRGESRAFSARHGRASQSNPQHITAPVQPACGKFVLTAQLLVYTFFKPDK